ncbi:MULTISPECIES: acyl carrier protein [unclassified Streptomyces]|uniref:acyl carrier protein n=1 Tax=unclassified Streptomyces TaxID=2593676 RepID=UPI003CF635D0
MTETLSGVGNDVRETVKALLAARLRLTPQSLDEEATLERVGLDSLLLSETLAAVEEEFDVALDIVSLAEHLYPTLPVGPLLDALAESVTAAA